MLITAPKVIISQVMLIIKPCEVFLQEILELKEIGGNRVSDIA